MIMNVSKGDTENMPNLRKAAMLLVVLGEVASAQLLQQLTEDEVQKVSREVAKITAISAEQSEVILEEFHQMCTAGDYVSRGGIDYARAEASVEVVDEGNLHQKVAPDRPGRVGRPADEP